METSEKYEKDEKVLCKHGLCTYPAKIVDVEEAENPEACKYLVHYQGWNPKWNEWLLNDRLTKFTEERAKLALEENKILLAQRKKKKTSTLTPKPAKGQSESDRASVASSAPDQTKLGDDTSLSVLTAGAGNSRGSSPSVESTVSSSAAVTAAVAKGGKPSRKSARAKADSAGGGSDVFSAGAAEPDPPSKRRKNAAGQTAMTSSSASGAGPPSVQSEQDYLNRPEVCIKIPDELKPILVDDWDLVVQQMKLVKLPAALTVSTIFENYVAEKQALKNISAAKLSQIVETAEGLCTYFDTMLASQLLYKFEKPQYDQLLQRDPSFSPSETYGFSHLMRLFVRLGHMLAIVALDEKSTSLLLAGVGEFLKYLKKIKPSPLSDMYEIASPEYQRLAYA